MRPFHRFIALAAFTALLACAQDVSGDWQGTLRAGAQEIRILLQIAKSDGGEWKATMLSIDQSPDRGARAPPTSFSAAGSSVRFTIDAVRSSYDGNLSADGASISGTWTQGRPLPLEFRRATKETAWLDPSPHRTEFIAVENNIKLEVLDWGGSGKTLGFVGWAWKHSSCIRQVRSQAIFGVPWRVCNDTYTVKTDRMTGRSPGSPFQQGPQVFENFPRRGIVRSQGFLCNK
jgi:hypothetical protein